MEFESQLAPGEVTLLAECGDLLGEGTLWDHRNGQLLWVDILRGIVHAWSWPGQVSELLRVDALVGSIALCGKKDLVLATSKGLMLWRDESGKVEFWLNPIANKPVRFNDGRVDAHGRFWVGTMALDAKRYCEPLGELYRVDRSGEVTLMEQGLTISNGLDWSPDGHTLYLTDTMRRAIYAYDFDADAGTITNRRTLIEMAGGDGYPDGLVVDAEGGLWSAAFAGGGIFHYDRNGKLLRAIDMPVSCPTALTFGGAGLSTAFVASSRHALAEDHTENRAGALFAINLGVRGRAAAIFGMGGDHELRHGTGHRSN